MVKSVNFVVLGEQSIANDFGKKGTSTDMTLFDKKESDIIRIEDKNACIRLAVFKDFLSLFILSLFTASL